MKKLYSFLADFSREVFPIVIVTVLCAGSLYAQNFPNAPTPAASSSGQSVSCVPGDATNGCYVQGSVASGATDAGNPVKVGGIANNTAPTAVTNGQRVNDWRTLNGATVISGVQSAATDASSNTLAFPARTDGTSQAIWATANYSFNGSTWDRMRGINGVTVGNAGTGILAAAIASTSNAGGGITSVVSASAEAGHVLKASAGNLYSVYATNLTSTAGFLAVVNSTTVPADGAVTPLECVPLPANGNASINYNPGPAAVFSTGISAFITSAATCFTKTTGVITGFIRGSVQ